jgi:SNF2 family DNA or RNA helicase
MYGRPLYQVNGGLATIYDWTAYADQLHEQIEKISYTVKTEDVIDLPEKRHEEIIVEMSKNVTNAYKELKYEMWTELQGKEIIVSTQLTNLLRLQQLANGIITIDGKTQQVDNVKEVALTELLEGIDPAEPVVVFSKFTKDLEIIENVARKLKRRYGEVSGKRKDLDENAEIPEGIQVMGVQLQAGGVGIDFTKARYCVYYSVGYNAADYEQSLARVHRPGQNKKVIYYHLIAKDTIDETIYDCLEKKGDLARLVLEGIKNGNNTGC